MPVRFISFLSVYARLIPMQADKDSRLTFVNV